MPVAGYVAEPVDLLQFSHSCAFYLDSRHFASFWLERHPGHKMPDRILEPRTGFAVGTRETVFDRNPVGAVEPVADQQPKLNEQGAMTDAEATFESTRGRSTLSIGLRFINYSAVFTPYQVLADRNVGGGLSLRYSYAFGR